MRKLPLMLLLAGFAMFSCDNNEDDPVVLTPDFEVTVTGDAPSASVSIVNNTVGAQTYAWTFTVDDVEFPSSTAETPAAFEVDKAGTLTVTLVASDGAQEKQLVKEVNIAGNNAILTYTDVAFGYNNGIVDYGSFYDVDEGKMYKETELNTTNGPTIDLVFSSLGASVLFFDSPANPNYNVPGGLASKVTNYQSTPDISLTDFDAMTDDAMLSGLTILHLDDSFSPSLVPHTVLFETNSGKKGVIKTKTIDDIHIVVDIKVQKY